MTAPNVVPLQPATGADRLEALARRPLQPRRALMLDLAARLRAFEALDREALDHGDDQLALDLEERAA